MSASRFHGLQTGISDRFHRIKSWATEKANSKPVLYVRGTVHGAIKAAYGVHYIFDLGLSFFPTTSPWYNGLKIIKYTMTGITFVVSTANACSQRKLEVSKQEIINQLELKLGEIDKALTEVDEIMAFERELLKKAGYSIFANTPYQGEGICIEELQPEAKTPIAQCKESKPFQSVKAVLNGAVKATGVHYIFKIGANFIPATRAYSIINSIASYGTFVGSIFLTYIQSHTQRDLETRTQRMDARLVIAQQKLQILEKILGTRKELISVAERGAETVNQRIWFETEETKEVIHPTSTPTIFKKLNCKGIKHARALTDGAVVAASIHNMIEILLPNAIFLQYLAAISALVFGVKNACVEREKKAFFQEKINGLTVEITEKQGVLDLAHSILAQEVEYVKQLISNPSTTYSEEKKIAKIEDSTQNILLMSFEEMERALPSDAQLSQQLYAMEAGMLRDEASETTSHTRMFDKNHYRPYVHLTDSLTYLKKSLLNP